MSTEFYNTIRTLTDLVIDFAARDNERQRSIALTELLRMANSGHTLIQEGVREKLLYFLGSSGWGWLTADLKKLAESDNLETALAATDILREAKAREIDTRVEEYRKQLEAAVS